MSSSNIDEEPSQLSDSTLPSCPSRLLVARLADLDRDVRQETALALGERAEEATLDSVLRQLWAEPDFFVRETLTWAITRIGAPAVPRVREAVAVGRESAVRTQALHVLSKIADPSTVDDIVTLIDDPDAAVAAKARWALARIGDDRAVPLLAGHLGAGDAETQNALTDVLASFGAAAVPALVEALRHEQSAVRKHAAEVLGHVGSPHADPAAPALGSAARDGDADVAIPALMALGALGSEEASIAIRRSTAANNPRVRAVAERLAARPPRQSRLEAVRAARTARLNAKE